jgi:hypothetical protein
MQTINHKSPYGGSYSLGVKYGSYQNGQVAIQLVDMEDGCPYATASVCVEDNLLKEGEVAIKNYSENAGILESLIESGIVDYPHAFVDTGYVKVPICKLITKPE